MKQKEKWAIESIENAVPLGPASAHDKHMWLLGFEFAKQLIDMDLSHICVNTDDIHNLILSLGEKP